MEKKIINGLDIEVYSEKLKNGLEVYIIPNSNVNDTYVTYSTRYGGMHNDFIPYEEEKMYYSKKGIAHFLEHKMFDQENKEDVFKYFSNRGSNANANTGYYKTTYLFSGPNDFYDNLKYLLNYVESPYFNDQSIEKEKGIIVEELEMYEDRPYNKLFNTCLYNAFFEHPIKYPIIGTVDSIKSITKEDLYKCYNTFYHPSNMFIVITGNVEPKKTIETIKQIEDKRKLHDNKKIVLKVYDEPDKVFKKEEIIEMDITTPKIAIAYKINTEKFKDININELYRYVITSFDLRLGVTSIINEKLRNDNLITDCICTDGIIAGKHIIILVSFETKKYDEVIKLIEKELEDLTISETDLKRKIRVNISNLISMTDNIYAFNSKISNDIIRYNRIEYDPIKKVKALNYKDINKLLSKIDISNKTICVIKPENK